MASGDMPSQKEDRRRRRRSRSSYRRRSHSSYRRRGDDGRRLDCAKDGADRVVGDGGGGSHRKADDDLSSAGTSLRTQRHHRARPALDPFITGSPSRPSACERKKKKLDGAEGGSNGNGSRGRSLSIARIKNGQNPMRSSSKHWEKEGRGGGHGYGRSLSTLRRAGTLLPNSGDATILAPIDSKGRRQRLLQSRSKTPSSRLPSSANPQKEASPVSSPRRAGRERSRSRGGDAHAEPSFQLEPSDDGGSDDEEEEPPRRTMEPEGRYASMVEDSAPGWHRDGRERSRSSRVDVNASFKRAVAGINGGVTGSSSPRCRAQATGGGDGRGKSASCSKPRERRHAEEEMRPRRSYSSQTADEDASTATAPPPPSSPEAESSSRSRSTSRSSGRRDEANNGRLAAADQDHDSNYELSHPSRKFVVEINSRGEVLRVHEVPRDGDGKDEPEPPPPPPERYRQKEEEEAMTWTVDNDDHRKHHRRLTGPREEARQERGEGRGRSAPRFRRAPTKKGNEDRHRCRRPASSSAAPRSNSGDGTAARAITPSRDDRSQFTKESRARARYGDFVAIVEELSRKSSSSRHHRSRSSASRSRNDGGRSRASSVGVGEDAQKKHAVAPATVLVDAADKSTVGNGEERSHIASDQLAGRSLEDHRPQEEELSSSMEDLWSMSTLISGGSEDLPCGLPTMCNHELASISSCERTDNYAGGGGCSPRRSSAALGVRSVRGGDSKKKAASSAQFIAGRGSKSARRPLPPRPAHLCSSMDTLYSEESESEGEDNDQATAAIANHGQMTHSPRSTTSDANEGSDDDDDAGAGPRRPPARVSLSDPDDESEGTAVLTYSTTDREPSPAPNNNGPLAASEPPLDLSDRSDGSSDSCRTVPSPAPNNVTAASSEPALDSSARSDVSGGSCRTFGLVDRDSQFCQASALSSSTAGQDVHRASALTNFMTKHNRNFHQASSALPSDLDESDGTVTTYSTSDREPSPAPNNGPVASSEPVLDSSDRSDGSSGSCRTFGLDGQFRRASAPSNPTASQKSQVVDRASVATSSVTKHNNQIHRASSLPSSVTSQESRGDYHVSAPTISMTGHGSYIHHAPASSSSTTIRGQFSPHQRQSRGRLDATNSVSTDGDYSPVSRRTRSLSRSHHPGHRNTRGHIAGDYCPNSFAANNCDRPKFVPPASSSSDPPPRKARSLSRTRYVAVRDHVDFDPPVVEKDVTRRPPPSCDDPRNEEPVSLRREARPPRENNILIQQGLVSHYTAKAYISEDLPFERRFEYGKGDPSLADNQTAQMAKGGTTYPINEDHFINCTFPIFESEGDDDDGDDDHSLLSNHTGIIDLGPSLSPQRLASEHNEAGRRTTSEEHDQGGDAGRNEPSSRKGGRGSRIRKMLSRKAPRNERSAGGPPPPVATGAANESGGVADGSNASILMNNAQKKTKSKLSRLLKR